MTAKYPYISHDDLVKLVDELFAHRPDGVTEDELAAAFRELKRMKVGWMEYELWLRKEVSFCFRDGSVCLVCLVCEPAENAEPDGS